MKRFAIAACASLWLAASALAQQPTTAANATAGSAPITVTPTSVAPTVEMWFYDQARRDYDDPKLAVRRKAEFEAAQRRHRIAAREWFGISKMRPPYTAVPAMSSSFSPGWISNTPNQPYSWTGNGVSPYIARPSVWWTSSMGMY